MIDRFSKYLVADYLDKFGYLLREDKEKKEFAIVDKFEGEIIGFVSWDNLAEGVFEMLREGVI